MIFTNGEQVLGTTSVKPTLNEGEFDGVIKEVNYLKDCKTDWGFRDFFEIVYGLSIGITEQVKKEKIMISQAENSKCYKFLMDIYKDDIPKEININEFVGRMCIVTIKHNTSPNGAVYANIVG